jgi:putative ABC transport system permease protein
MIQDLRFGLRMLLKNRGFTAIAVITLAIGVGANTAIFSIINAVFLRPLPYPQPERIVRVFETGKVGNEITISAPNFLDWQGQQTSFERLAAFQNDVFDLAGQDGIEQVAGIHASAGIFPLLGARIVQGRVFLPDDDKPDAQRVVLISHEFWQARYGANPGAVGETLALGGQSYTIIGVLARDFEFISPANELWVPLRLGNEGQRMRRTERYLHAVARLRPGVTLRQAQAEMDIIAARLAQQYPDANAAAGARLVPLQDHLFGNLRGSLLVLQGAVIFVLLIACANLANLMLSRSSSRRKEFAVRTALGAGRWRMARQLLTESACLSLLGGAVGLLLAGWSVTGLMRLWQQSGEGSAPAISRVNSVGLDAVTLGFTLLTLLFAALIFGFVPAWQADRFDLIESLKEGRKGVFALWSGRRIQNAMVVAEMALALALLAGAGLMINSLWRLSRVNPGFDAEHLLTMKIAPPVSFLAGDPEEASRKIAAFFRDVTERVKNVPGVVTADVINVTPLAGEGALTRLTIENRLPASPADVRSVPWRVLGPDYFRAMKIPLLQGRHFTAADTSDAPGVVIINEALARHFWPNENPVGRRIRRGGLDSQRPWSTVVGVVGTVKTYGLDKVPIPELYIPHAQFALPPMTLVARATDDPLKLVSALRSQILAVDRNSLITNVRTMEEWLSRSVASRRFNMQLLAIFAAMALLLAGVGIYGVMNYAVTQLTHELGIRMALGAQTGDLMRLVIRRGMGMTLIGVVIGLFAAFLLTRSMKGLLFAVGPGDPLTFALVATLLVVVALLACYIPARRATKVDPLVALRGE